MRAFGGDVTNFKHSVRHYFMLHRKVVIQIAGDLEGWRSGRHQVGGAKRGTCNLAASAKRIIEQVESAGVRRVCDGRGLNERRILERILFPDAVERAVIEQAYSGTHCPLAVSKRIVCQTKARPPVVAGIWI